MYKDPNNEEITVIVNREQRTLFYGTANGTLRRLDFPSSEIGGTCQSTLLQSGHVHPGTPPRTAKPGPLRLVNSPFDCRFLATSTTTTCTHRYVHTLYASGFFGSAEQ